MRVKLLKKFAEVINDVDLGPYVPGDEFDCADSEGRMLILEGWAEAVVDERQLDSVGLASTLWEIIELHREGQKDRMS